jgi:hypothetical protein
MSKTKKTIAIIPSVAALFAEGVEINAEVVQEVLNAEIALAVEADQAEKIAAALAPVQEELETLKLEHSTCHETIEVLQAANEDLTVELQAANGIVADLKKETKDVFTPGVYKSKVTKYSYRIKKGFKKIIVPGFNQNRPIDSSEVINNAEMMEKLIRIQYGGVEIVRT